MPVRCFSISFGKGQLAKVTESLADNLKENNIYALKFGREINRKIKRIPALNFLALIFHLSIREEYWQDLE